MIPNRHTSLIMHRVATGNHGILTLRAEIFMHFEENFSHGIRRRNFDSREICCLIAKKLKLFLSWQQLNHLEDTTCLHSSRGLKGLIKSKEGKKFVVYTHNRTSYFLVASILFAIHPNNAHHFCSQTGTIDLFRGENNDRLLIYHQSNLQLNSTKMISETAAEHICTSVLQNVWRRNFLSYNLMSFSQPLEWNMYKDKRSS